MLRVNINKPAANLLQNCKIDRGVIEESSRFSGRCYFTPEYSLLIIINLICLKQFIEVISANVETCLNDTLLILTEQRRRISPLSKDKTKGAQKN